MVDDGFFVLPFLPTPQAMGYPVEMMVCVGVVDPGQTHDLRRF